MGVDPAGPRPGGTESPPLQWHSRPPLGSGAGLGCGEGRGQTAWAGHGATLSACLTAPAGCRQPHGQRRASITLVRLIRKAVFVVNFFHAEQKNTTKSSMSCSPTSQRATCSSLPLPPPSAHQAKLSTSTVATCGLPPRPPDPCCGHTRSPGPPCSR